MTDTVTPLSTYREYEPHELGQDGYPTGWHDLGDGQGIKHLVRAQAGNRCVRCCHPYEAGQFTSDTPPAAADPLPSAQLPLLDGVSFDSIPSEERPARGSNWSACDSDCTHLGPYRFRLSDDDPWTVFDGPAASPIAPRIATGATVEAAWRILTVHHLNQRKHDCRWFNLAALCQRCHLVIQRKVTMERVYPFEHTEWFRPFAAGWYAFAYLGENLTREQTIARLDELLALEQMV